MIIEIRTYRLIQGERHEFVRVMVEETLPLLRAAGIRVVAAGGSLVDEDGHEEAYLIRAFASLDEHAEQESAFYRSAVWLTGPREAILSRIESFHSVVLELSEDQVMALEGGQA